MCDIYPYWSQCTKITPFRQTYHLCRFFLLRYWSDFCNEFGYFDILTSIWVNITHQITTNYRYFGSETQEINHFFLKCLVVNPDWIARASTCVILSNELTWSSGLAVALKHVLSHQHEKIHWCTLSKHFTYMWQI